MKRIRIADRILPTYTVGEERMNMITHIVGGALGILALILCIARSAIHHDIWGMVGSSIYGASLIALYTVSSVYHGLHISIGKKVMQVIDHCTIYFLICGTYTPLLLTAIRRESPAWAWVIFGIVWGLAVLAAVLTAIDLKKYAVFSMICYICMGWCIVLALPTTVRAIGEPGFAWLLAGGIAYTVGAVLYGLGKKHRYMHSVFHLFVLLGSIFQFVCIYGCVL